jgi:hypothetical protein
MLYRYWIGSSITCFLLHPFTETAFRECSWCHTRVRVRRSPKLHACVRPGAHPLAAMPDSLGSGSRAGFCRLCRLYQPCCFCRCGAAMFRVVVRNTFVDVEEAGSTSSRRRSSSCPPAVRCDVVRTAKRASFPKPTCPCGWAISQAGVVFRKLLSCHSKPKPPILSACC